MGFYCQSAGRAKPKNTTNCSSQKHHTKHHPNKTSHSGHKSCAGMPKHALGTPSRCSSVTLGRSSPAATLDACTLRVFTSVFGLCSKCFFGIMSFPHCLSKSALQRRSDVLLNLTVFVATFRIARLTLQTRKLWLVGRCVAADRNALPLTCLDVKNLYTTKNQRNSSKKVKNEKNNFFLKNNNNSKNLKNEIQKKKKRKRGLQGAYLPRRLKNKISI